MTRLRTLRTRLARFRRRRRLARWLAAYSALVIAVLWTLWATLAADWLLDMDNTQRTVTLVCSMGFVVWAFGRFVRPWLGWRESLIDLALLAQRQQQFDSDLVAAIQFESPEAASWGSRQLEEAVIQQVAASVARLRPVVDIPSKLISRRLAALVLSVLVTAALAVVIPDHWKTFLDRLLFRPARYPTRTVIESLAINGAAIDLTDCSGEITCLYGFPLRLALSCSGRLPPSARAALAAGKGRVGTAIELEASQAQGTYVGQWPRLVDAAALEVFAGDARAGPFHLVVVPPPRVDLQFEVTPPGYASDATQPFEIVSGLRQLAVPEGSRIVIRVLSNKRLREAVATIEGSPHRLARDAARLSSQAPARSTGQAVPSAPSPAMVDSADLWKLDPSDTRLAEVTEPVRYVIQVADEDGLSPERPLEGVIRVKPDRPPDIAVSALTTLVLPTARPTISFAASDDYGLAEIVAIAEVVRPDGTLGKKIEQRLYGLPNAEGVKKNVQDRQRFSLAPLKAARGDQIKVTLRATDHRGDRPAKSAISEPLLLQVTDEQGIYAAMAEADRKSARRLQGMIEDQIGVGGGK